MYEQSIGYNLYIRTCPDSATFVDNHCNTYRKMVVVGVPFPPHFGKWYAIYQRFRRWIALGIFDHIEKELQMQAIAIKGVKSLAIDSTYIKVHPDGTGAPKKRTAVYR